MFNCLCLQSHIMFILKVSAKPSLTTYFNILLILTLVIKCMIKIVMLVFRQPEHLMLRLGMIVMWLNIEKVNADL